MARKFDIELNGIITLTYTDNNTGRRQQTKLKPLSVKVTVAKIVFLQQYSCYRFSCNGANRADKTDIKFLQHDN